MHPSNPALLTHSLLGETVKKQRNTKTLQSPQLQKTSHDVLKRKSHEADSSKMLIGNFCSLFKLAEAKCPNSAVQIYMVALSIMIWIGFKIKGLFLQDIADLEVLGIGLTLAFVLNLVFTKDVKRKIFRSKKANFCFVKDILISVSGSLVFLFYGFQILPFPISLSIYSSAFVLVILLETMICEKEVSASHLILAVCAYVGVILALFDSNNLNSEATNLWLLYGIGIIGLSGIFLAAVFIKFSQITEPHLLSLNGSFALLSVLTVAFLEKKLKWPTLMQTFFLVILGALIFFCFTLLTRSFQLTEAAGEISPYLYLSASMDPLFAWLFTKDELNLRAIGSLLTQASLVLLWLVTPKSMKSTEIRQLDSVIAVEIEMTEKSLNTTYD